MYGHGATRPQVQVLQTYVTRSGFSVEAHRYQMNALDIEPTKPEFLSRTRGGNLIPVSCELPADLETPISTFMKVRGGGDAFLLESVEGGERIGRYSFIGSRPMMTIVSRGEQVEIREGSSGDGAESLRVERQTADVLEVTRNILRRHRPVPDPSLPRFAGGAAGHFGYHLGCSWERLPNRPPEGLCAPASHPALAHTMGTFYPLRDTM